MQGLCGKNAAMLLGKFSHRTDFLAAVSDTVNVVVDVKQTCGLFGLLFGQGTAGKHFYNITANLFLKLLHSKMHFFKILIRCQWFFSHKCKLHAIHHLPGKIRDTLDLLRNQIKSRCRLRQNPVFQELRFKGLALLLILPAHQTGNDLYHNRD